MRKTLTMPAGQGSGAQLGGHWMHQQGVHELERPNIHGHHLVADQWRRLCGSRLGAAGEESSKQLTHVVPATRGQRCTGDRQVTARMVRVVHC